MERKGSAREAKADEEEERVETEEGGEEDKEEWEYVEEV